MQLETSGAQLGDPQTAISGSDDGVLIIAGRRYFTPERLAKILGKSVRTLARWHELRVGPPRTRVGKQPLYDEEKLPGWLAEFETRPVKPGCRR